MLTTTSPSHYYFMFIPYFYTEYNTIMIQFVSKMSCVCRLYNGCQYKCEDFLFFKIFSISEHTYIVIHLKYCPADLQDKGMTDINMIYHLQLLTGCII